MKLKYKVIFLASKNAWFVAKNKDEHFTTPYATEQEAVERALTREGCELLAKLDDVQRRMESIPGMISDSDPYGWRA